MARRIIKEEYVPFRELVEIIQAIVDQEGINVSGTLSPGCDTPYKIRQSLCEQCIEAAGEEIWKATQEVAKRQKERIKG